MRRQSVRLVFVAIALMASATAARAQEDRPVARLMSLPSDSIEFMVGGRIVSAEDGQPVGGVQVFLEGTTIGALTDAGGLFRLDGEEAGAQRLRTRLIGYESICMNIELFADRMQSVRPLPVTDS